MDSQNYRKIVARPMLAIRSIAWKDDPETGYKIPTQEANFPELLGSNPPVPSGDGRLKHDGLILGWAFTPSDKQKFIDELPAHWPNITAACEAVGITRQTYTAHLAIDEKFRMDCQAVVDSKVDELEARFWEFGKRPKNYMDRITVARAYRPEVYDPAKKVQLEVTHHSEMSDAQADELARRAAGAVDAEIVSEQFRAPTPEIPGAVGIDGATDGGNEAVNRKDVPGDAA